MRSSQLQRKHPRLHNYNYRKTGAYFITVCAAGRARIFGHVMGDAVILSATGATVAACWDDLPNHHSGVELDAFVIMPDHLHGIIIIHREHSEIAPLLGFTAERARPASSLHGNDRLVGARPASPDPVPEAQDRASGVAPHSLSAIVGSFKAAVTRKSKAMGIEPGYQLWQRGYYEHIIRNEDDLAKIRDYIQTNPARWAGRGVG